METYNPFTLLGKKVIITGASSGIGQQCAIDCSKMGAQLIIIGRNKDRLYKTSTKLAGSGHVMICEDLVNYDLINDIIQETILNLGPIDGFIHAAGIEKTQLLKNFKPKDYIDIFNTNFISGMNLLKAITRKNFYNPGLKVIFICSITAVIARVGTLAYTASKGALVSAVRELSIELAPKGINVNCVSPGTIMTPMMEKALSQMTEDNRQKRLKGFALGIGYPRDISNVCVFLLSNASRWITGQNFVVDGGYTVQ